MSTMTARERMLGRLRAAAPANTAGGEAIDARIDAWYGRRREASPLTRSELVAAMQHAMTASHAEVLCADAQTWPQLLAEKLAAAGVRRLLLDASTAEGTALAAALPETVRHLPYAQPIDAWKAELFDTIDAGFTVARSGIASTGTLILAPDAGTPRTVSLVPPLHVALVHASTLHPDMHAAVHVERWSEGMPTNLVMASGPSKTSDIQQTLAFGAHGPRWMWVVIVTEGEAS